MAHEDRALLAEILNLSREKSAMIAAAESCTGGMIAAALTTLPGSSASFDRGFVTYTNAAKMALLDVGPDTLSRFGAVSEPVAREMAQGALAQSDAHLAVSVTGIAGPGGSEHKPEGRVCFGLSQVGQPTQVETVEFGAIGRDAVRAATRDHALRLLREGLQKLPAQ